MHLDDPRFWYELPVDRYPEATGTLSVLEFGRHIPFEVRRVYWVSGVTSPDLKRGDHAHGALRQVLFCAKGRCDIYLETRDGATATVSLGEDGPALYLDGRVWRTMRDFSPDCSLMVLCDREYAQDTVIRDRAEWLGR